MAACKGPIQRRQLMETNMSGIDELDAQLRDFANLSPEQQDQVRRRVIGRAEAMRAELIRNLFRRLVTWVRRRKAVAQLQAFDDRMLKDMGITRGEIESAVRGCDRRRGMVASVHQRAAC